MAAASVIFLQLVTAFHTVRRHQPHLVPDGRELLTSVVRRYSNLDTDQGGKKVTISFRLKRLLIVTFTAESAPQTSKACLATFSLIGVITSMAELLCSVR